MSYIGRFAPSPTGPLHAGSLVAALASWLDARAHGGQWLVRMEDVDTPRITAGADAHILNQLRTLGMRPDADGSVQWQSTRTALYQDALTHLAHSGLLYACDCSRQTIASALARAGTLPSRHAAAVYPGTCRHRLPARPINTSACAVRINTQASATICWQDRGLGAQQQALANEVGDFVLRRADGVWAYQLAVVVDDADQGVTHVVRGADLIDNTARQQFLQANLGLKPLIYLHTPLVLAGDGQKLSKQNGAAALDLSDPLTCLCTAATALGLPAPSDDRRQHLSDPYALLQTWIPAWSAKWMCH
ncbi:tRNA glutamyl-Q(34) synthetase GluQRS [Burkholderiaceae bacterium]|nr:tRNA glutamyl-Q(34) synthetase GluQRS [Burkholderiaceae bacterium]